MKLLSSKSGLGYILIPGLIALLVILGGGTPVWVQGGVLLCIGISLTFRPPKLSLGRSFDLITLGILVVSLLALLPSGALPYGAWRDAAINQYGIVLPWSVAPLIQPLLEHFLFLLSALGFVYITLSLDYGLGARRKGIQCMVVFSTLLALVMLIGNSLGLKYIFAENSTIFSYFPNRNQTSTFFCMNAVLAFSSSIVSFRCQRYRWAGPAAGCFVILSLAVFGSVSRAGMFLLFVGALSFFIFKPFSDKSRLFLRVIIPSFVVLVSLFLSLGGSAVYRLETLFKEKSDYRIDVYEDTMRMIADYPLTGVGGGNFSAVFPQYEHKSAIDQRLLHPESDWLWFVSETGFLGLFLLLVFLFYLFKGVFPFGRGEHEAVRVIPATALTVFLFHSLVDVPAHRMGTLYLAIFLLGLAVSSVKKVPTLYPSWGFRISGIVLLLFGALWVAAGVGFHSFHSSTGLSYNGERILRAERIQDLALLKDATGAAIRAQPLDWWPYFERAKYFLAQGDIRAAEADFSRARFLEPSAQEVAYYEGLSWLSFSPSRAYNAWSEALKRKASNRSGMYENMRLAVIGHKNFYPYFRKLTLQDRDFRYYFLSVITDADFSKEMAWETTHGPRLTEFTKEEKITLIQRWIKSGGGEPARMFLESQPELLKSVPELQAEVFAWRENYDKASLLLLRTEPEIMIPEVSELRRPKELVRVFKKNPSDLWVGVSLFRYYLELEAYEEALQILNKLKLQGKQPLFVYYWIARLYTNSGQYQKAWISWREYLKVKARNAS